MKVMVIDTALGACAAGVFQGAPGAPLDALGGRTELMTKGHQERLAGFARDAAAQAGGFDGVERIGVTVGPGSFTGLRVGLAFALGLGAALDRPVVGISTLDALAASVPADHADGLVAAVIDARRGQVYARLFRDGAPLGEAQALELETARDLILTASDGATPVLIGSGAAVLAEAFPEAFAGAVMIALPAPDMATIASLALAADPTSAPARPLYLRAPDATPPSRLPGQPRPSAA